MAFLNIRVRKIITEEYILISLFVDDKTALEKPYEVIENGKITKIRTLGDKWSYLQRYKFGANSQPYYVLLDNDAKPLKKPFFFSENASDFLKFLKQGLSKYKKNSKK